MEPEGGREYDRSNANRLELIVTSKHLRFSMVRTTIALGLTLANLAKGERLETQTNRSGRRSWKTLSGTTMFGGNGVKCGGEAVGS
jgi:hypothetical protein